VTPVVRRAHAGDKIRVIRLLRDAHRAAGFADGSNPLQYPFRPAYAERAFLAHTSTPDATCIVLDVAGRAEGVLMARCGDYELGDLRIAKETVWWIDPDHRGLAADEMLAAFETWAASRGASVVGMAALAVAPRAARLYGRRGYAPVETNFLKPITPALIA
jgi:hypothetical protein